MKDVERRVAPVEKLELRGKPGDGAILSGYVAKYMVPSEVLWDIRSGRFVEFITPTAFTKTIKEGDIRATRNHNPDLLLGRTKNLNNIRFLSDTTGLYHELDVPDTQTARDVYRDVELGLLDNMSFQFRTILDRWKRDAEIPERSLLEVALEDIAYVTYPAYPQSTANARAAMRSFADACGCELEELIDLREASQETAEEHEEVPAAPQSERDRQRKCREFELMLLELGITD